MEVDLRGEKVQYELKVSKIIRGIKLAIHFDGKFIVTAPQNTNLNIVNNFIKEKTNWVFKKLNYFKKFSNRVVIKINKKDYIDRKVEILKKVKDRIDFFNKLYGYSIGKITIKNQKTRWGSCSKVGNLNFNYKVIYLKPNLFDYIIVHEICHLGEFNHSVRFWNLVSMAIPDYKKLRSELRDNKIIFLK
ncbi:MAG: M48 family metallopeptidase [bacterium]